MSSNLVGFSLFENATNQSKGLMSSMLVFYDIPIDNSVQDVEDAFKSYSEILKVLLKLEDAYNNAVTINKEYRFAKESFEEAKSILEEAKSNYERTKIALDLVDQKTKHCESFEKLATQLRAMYEKRATTEQKFIDVLRAAQSRVDQLLKQNPNDSVAKKELIDIKKIEQEYKFRFMI
jgi:predicted metal-dependent hydrolase